MSSARSAPGVTADGLSLLLRLGRIESPLLVHRARGSNLRVQTTSLASTRRLVQAVNDAGSATLALRPVRRDFADLEQDAAEARVSDIGPKVTALALAQVGIPYSWGGGNARGASRGTCAGYRGSIRPCPATRTVGFDCSGLMLYAYAQVGISLDHYAAFQFLEGRRIADTNLMPGDLVFFHPKRDGPGHVGMYVGTGRFVHAAANRRRREGQPARGLRGVVHGRRPAVLTHRPGVQSAVPSRARRRPSLTCTNTSASVRAEANRIISNPAISAPLAI